ncbi:hypothetical protein P4C99_21455 [Pontiellaceae bacterium B1224]|nr:hypothetical protein [Pontiellaceae bacterium B1224]
MIPERKNRMGNYIKNHPLDFSFIIVSGLTAIIVGMSFPIWIMMGMGYTNDPTVKMGTSLGFGISGCYPTFWGLLLFFRKAARKESFERTRNFMINAIQVALVGSWLFAVIGSIQALRMLGWI